VSLLSRELQRCSALDVRRARAERREVQAQGNRHVATELRTAPATIAAVLPERAAHARAGLIVVACARPRR